MARQGILVEPYQRLNEKQITQIHQASMEILINPGIICFNRDAADIFADGGAEVTVDLLLLGGDLLSTLPFALFDRQPDALPTNVISLLQPSPT